MLDLDEATTRWARVRKMMETFDVDLLIAVDLSRDEILLGHQRWLTGYVPIGGPAAALIGRAGPIVLVSDRIGKPASSYYKANGLPVEMVNGFTPPLLAELVAAHQPRGIGIADPVSLPWSVAAALRERLPACRLIDLSEPMQRLRLRKSAHELALIRKSCEIADEVWEHAPEIFRVGRRMYEIVADVDYLMRLKRAEGGFNLVLPLPFSGRSMQAIANPDWIEAGARYLLEVSPRYEGYYSQITIPVTTRADDQVAARAYADIVEAKEAALPHMRPGADLSEIATLVSGVLAKKGRELASLSLGHFCGMALEEPRHDPTMPFFLDESMTLIFHPILADPELRSLMRADTYLITASGAERMNSYNGGILATL